MKRPPRSRAALAVACILSTPLLSATALHALDVPADVPAPAAPAPAAAPAAAPAPAAPAADIAAPAVNKELAQAADDFWHYASVGRYDLAKAAADTMTSGSASPLDLLLAFESVAADRNQRVPADRKVDLYERMLAWQRVPELKDSSAKLLGIFRQGQFTRRSNPTVIESNILRLGNGQRAYVLAVEQLKESGELAVPIMIDYLRNPKHKELQVPIRSALHDLGYRALNPLVAATDMKDWNTLTWVASSLGDLGYDLAVPYLVRLVQSKDAPDTAKAAATEALLRLNVTDPRSQNASQLFLDLADKFYYDKAAIRADMTQTVAYMWHWEEAGLRKTDVPVAVFNEDMALRSSESALKLDSKLSPAVSLWLAAGFKREVELPAGAADPTWDAKHPATHYYAVASGTSHLDPALSRALGDHDAAVAFKAIKSLQEIAGASNLFEGENHPILDALSYPDRQVRFEAAFAVAQSLPQKPFEGQLRVVPILAEALAQTGKPGILVMADSQDTLNQLTSALGQAAAVKGGTSPDTTIDAASSLTGVDVIVMKEGDKQLDRLFELARQNIRLERAAKLIIVHSKAASPYAALAANDPLVTLTDAAPTDGAAMTAAIEEARKRAGALSMDDKTATAYALRSAELLGELAISRGQVLDLAAAQSALLAALDDARPEISKATGDVLAAINTKEAQAALLVRAADAKTPNDMKIHFFKNLATNAKFFGNQLAGNEVDSLTKIVEDTAGDLDVRSAAAEAQGALNLSSNQVTTLILNQAK